MAWARLSAGATIDEEHEVVVPRVEETSVQPNCRENLLSGLLQVIGGEHARRCREQASRRVEIEPGGVQELRDRLAAASSVQRP